MSAHRSKQLFVEINEFCALVVQTESRGQRTTVESIREVGFVDRASAEPPIAAESKEATPEAIHCVVRPGICVHHLATADEARQLVTADSIRHHLANGPFSALGAWHLALAASGEAPLGSGGRAGRWLAAGAPASALEAARRRVEGLEAAPREIGSAVFGHLAAVRRLLKSTGQSGTVVVFELGVPSSSAFLVNCEGVQAAVPVAVGFDHVVDAVAQEANLRMRGAAAKLVFNPSFDFSELAPKIAARLAGEVKAAISRLNAGRDRPPIALACAGLPSSQAWLNHSLSEALEIDLWRPSLRTWIEKAGIVFADALRDQPLAPEWLGILGTVEAGHREIVPEKSSWFGEVTAAANPPSVTVSTGNASAPAPVAAVRVETPQALHKRPVPSFPRPLAQSPAVVDAARPDAGAIGAEGGVEPNEIGAPSRELQAAFAAQPERAAPADRSRRLKLVPIFSLAAVVAVVGALGVVYFRQVAHQKAEAAAEIAAAEQRAAADAEALRLAEQRAREEAEARRKAEELAAEQVARAEEARLLAEQQGREREVEARRLLAARGSVRIVTEPEGAIVAVGNYAPQRTPALVDDLRLGKYPTTVTLEGYDPFSFEVEIADGAITDPGVIRLVRQLGTIAIETDPSGVLYDVRPADARLFVASAETRQGTTPGRIDDLPPGDYVVALLRDGWPRHTQTVTVKNHETTNVGHHFAGATLSFASEPAGATVLLNGVSIGTTPLSLADVPPGALKVSFALEDFHPLEVERVAEGGRPLDINVSLESLERIARLGELDAAPVPVLQVQPNLPPAAGTVEGRVMIVCVVGRDGVPQEVTVAEAPDEGIGRVCREAVEQWRFIPGMIKGKPVKTRVSIPFLIH